MVFRDRSQLFDEISAMGLEVNGLTPFDSSYLQLHPGVQFCLILRGITTKELSKMGGLPWFLLGLPSLWRHCQCAGREEPSQSVQKENSSTFKSN